MFSHLVESDLHTGDFKRKGSFFLATLAAYALVLMATGVVGVYAYEAQIDDQNLELVALVPPDMDEPERPKEAPPKLKVAPATQQQEAMGSRNLGNSGKTVNSNISPDPTIFSGTAKTETTQKLPNVGGGPQRNYNFGTGPYNPNAGDDGSSSSKSGGKSGGIIEEDAPGLAKKEPPDKQKIKYLGVVTSRALQLPEPVYPPIAKAAGVQGTVAVEILIDETGKVVSAHTTSGHPLLKQEAVRAALRARFSPTYVSEQAVKAKGIITFNFVLRK